MKRGPILLLYRLENHTINSDYVGTIKKCQAEIEEINKQTRLMNNELYE